MRLTRGLLIKLGYHAALLCPLLPLLFLPAAALAPDQGHELIISGISDHEWAYLVFVVAPLAFTALLHSAQMLCRSAAIGEASGEISDSITKRAVLYALLTTLAGLAILAIPLFQFKLEEAECVMVVAENKCRPTLALLQLAGYVNTLLFLPFLLHYRAAAQKIANRRLVRVVLSCSPIITQLLLLALVAALLATQHSTTRDYLPLLLGALAALFIARLPDLAVTKELSTHASYWRKFRICIAGAEPTILLATTAPPRGTAG